MWYEDVVHVGFFMNSSQLQKIRKKKNFHSLYKFRLEMLESWHDVMVHHGFGTEKLIPFNIKDINT